MTAITAKPLTARPLTARPLTAYPLGQSTDAASVFNPVSLFASGEDGAYFDAATIATLLQDSAGTTPVTAVGQPIGLLLDQSQGTVDLAGNLGAELISNGGFDTDTTGWDSPASSPGATLSAIAGELRGLAANIGNEVRASTSFSTVVGKKYVVAFDAYSAPGSILYMGIGTYPGGNDSTGYLVLGDTSTSKTPFLYVFTATVTTSYFVVLGYSASVIPTFYLDNASVKEVPGNHAIQSTSTARPVLAELSGARYVNFDGVDDELDVTMPDLGSGATIALIADDGTVSYQESQTISGAITLSTDFQKLLYIDRALTAAEKAGWESLA